MRSLRLILAVALLLGISGSVWTARADMAVSGSTTGSFSTDWKYLTFQGTSLSSTTGADVVLGTFTLQNRPALYLGTFTLTVTFNDPMGTSGSPVVGLLGGAVAFGHGGVYITFPVPAHFSFPGGTFDLAAHSVALGPGSSSPLIGTLRGGAVTPESLDVLLCLPACMGVLGFIRRKFAARDLS